MPLIDFPDIHPAPTPTDAQTIIETPDSDNARPCPACDMGYCPECAGHGYFEWPACPPYSLVTRVCTACGGSCRCQTCGGKATLPRIDESELLNDPSQFLGIA